MLHHLVYCSSRKIYITIIIELKQIIGNILSDENIIHNYKAKAVVISSLSSESANFLVIDT